MTNMSPSTIHVFMLLCVTRLSLAGSEGYQGTDFVLAIIDNAGSGHSTYTPSIQVNTDQTTAVHVHYHGATKSYTVQPGSTVISLDRSVTCKGTALSDKGIRITTNNPVSVHGFIYAGSTSDGFFVLPVNALSTEYIVASYPPSGNSEFAITGVEPSTRVSILIKTSGGGSVTYKGHTYHSGDTLTETIRQLHTLQIQSSSDLTGTFINADRPISVISGADCADVPTSSSACDVLAEFLLPVSSWDTDFIVPAFATRSGHIIRIIASVDGTSITTTGKGSHSLQRSEHAEYRFAGAAPIVVSANKPILVVQFIEGTTVDHQTGDPSMIIVPGVRQYLSDYIFKIPPHFTTSHLNIIVKTSDISNIRFDGNNITTVTQSNISVPDLQDTFSVLTFGLTSDQHHMTSSSTWIRFGALMYGFERANSYGLPLGIGNNTAITPVRLVGGSNPTEGRVEVYVTGQWGTICDDKFTKQDADVICHMLGYHFGPELNNFESSAYFGPGTGHTLVDDLHCTGAETDISQCRFTPGPDSNCQHSEDVGVRCGTSVRLVNDSASTSSSQSGTGASGRLEILYHGHWGTVCDDSFDTHDAAVVCRMLGYKYGPGVGGGVYTAGNGSGQIVLDNVRCVGNEVDISLCPANPVLTNDCTHAEDVGIDCSTSVRLVNGSHPMEGRVEVFYNGVWGTICKDGFDKDDGDVICRNLGYHHGMSYLHGSDVYGTGSGPALIKNMRCSGHETDISLCPSDLWQTTSCHQSQTVGVDCAPTLTQSVESHCHVTGWNTGVNMTSLRLRYPDAKASDIYFGENSCTGVLKGEILTFEYGLHDCQVTETTSAEWLSYRTQLIYALHDPVHPFIIRNYNWSVTLECNISRTGNGDSHINVNPAKNPVLHLNSTNAGSVNIDFFRDPSFTQKLDGSPVLQVSPGTSVYTKVYSTNSDWSVKMRLRDCYTVPSQGAKDGGKYYLIRNGCEADVNTHFLSTTTHETQFVFTVFSASTGGLRLHCDADLCGPADLSSNCTRTCT